MKKKSVLVDFYDYATKGKELFDAGDYEKAEKFYKKGFELADSDGRIWIWNLLGELYDKKGEIEKAIDVYETAIAQKTDALAIYQRLISIYERSNRIEDAIRICDLAIQRCSHAADDFKGLKERIKRINGISVKILSYIQTNEGVLQTELYKVFPSIERSDISSILYWAEKNGQINRKKEGRTYRLYSKKE